MAGWVRLAAGLAAACSAAMAGATGLDFEDIDPGLNGVYLGLGMPTSSVLSQGWQVTYLPGDFAIINDNRSQGVLFSGNGSTRMLTANGGAIRVTDPAGGSFRALGFDGGETWIAGPHYWATAIEVRGWRSDGSPVVQSFALDLVRDPVLGMQAFSLGDGFGDLTAIEFRGLGGNPDFSIDNLALLPVPEVAPGWMWAAGLCALAAWRRRDRAGRGSDRDAGHPAHDAG